MLRVMIRSRIGNAVLAVLGVVYFLSAAATLTYYIVSNWGANGMIDYALQFALVCAAAGGILFFMIGAGNLSAVKPAAGRSTAPMQAHPAA